MEEMEAVLAAMAVVALFAIAICVVGALTIGWVTVW
jgi:hypothetical protein